MPDTLDLPDSPDLYTIEKQSDRTCAVIYTPDDHVVCYVPARDDCPDIDARYQAGMIAGALNATVNMCAIDIAELFDAYEEQHGRRHHSDWRPESNE